VRQVLTQWGGARGGPRDRRPTALPGRFACQSVRRGRRDEASTLHAMSRGEDGAEGRGGDVGTGSGAGGRRGPTEGAAGTVLSGYSWLRRGLAPAQREVGDSLSSIEHSWGRNARVARTSVDTRHADGVHVREVSQQGRASTRWSALSLWQSRGYMATT